MTLAVLFLGNDRSELGVALRERPRPLCSSQGWEEKGMEKVTKWRMSVRCFTMRQTAHVDAWRVAIVEMDGVRSLDSIVESSLFIELCLFKEGVSEIQTLQVRREKKRNRRKKKNE